MQTIRGIESDMSKGTGAPAGGAQQKVEFQQPESGLSRAWRVTRFAGYAVLMVIGGFEGVVLAQAISSIPQFTVHSSVRSIMIFGVSYLVLFAVTWSATQLAVIVENIIIRDILIEKKIAFIEAKLRYVSAAKASEVVSRINNDFDLYSESYLKAKFFIAVDLTTGMVSMAYVLWLSVPVGLMFIAFSLLPMTVPRMFSSVLKKAGERWSKNTEGFNKVLSDTFSSQHSLYTNGAFGPVTAYLRKWLRKSESSKCTMNNLQGVAGIATLMLSAASYLIPITIGLLMMRAGWAITATSLVAMFLASDRVSGPFRAAAGHFNEISTTKEIREQMRSTLNETPQAPVLTRMEETAATAQIGVKAQIGAATQGKAGAAAGNPSTPQSAGSNSDTAARVIVNVPAVVHGDTTLLQGQRLDIAKTKKIALVGPSGVGKSSLLNALQGFVVDRDMQTDDDLVRQVGFIEQRPFIFDENVRFNLTFGETFADDRLLSALEQVGLLHELGNDPLNYECGQNGSHLSGGQIQRLEIARALLRRKQLLLADEPTASLDEHNAKLIVALLCSLPNTLIMATHDLQYVKDFDAILEITPDHQLTAANERGGVGEDVISVTPSASLA
jgi:ATP-binding cassette subfamily C protein